jgi:hypothetical protein
VRERCRKCVDRFSRALRHLFVIAKLCQPQKIQRCDGAGRGLGAVVIVFHSEENAFVVAAGAEIAALALVEKQAVLRLLQLGREFQPFDIERGFVKIEKTLDHECVIVGEALNTAAATAIVAIQNLARRVE